MHELVTISHEWKSCQSMEILTLPTKLGYSNLCGTDGIVCITCRQKAESAEFRGVVGGKNSDYLSNWGRQGGGNNDYLFNWGQGGGNIKILHLAPKFRGVAEHKYQGKFEHQLSGRKKYLRTSIYTKPAHPLTARDQVSLLWLSWLCISAFQGQND